MGLITKIKLLYPRPSLGACIFILMSEDDANFAIDSLVAGLTYGHMNLNRTIIPATLAPFVNLVTTLKIRFLRIHAGGSPKQRVSSTS